jgi:hypothetical protein
VNWKIRLRGLVIAVVGFGVAAVLISLQLATGAGRVVIAGPLLGIGMVGLVELVSGYPFYQVAAKWDAMPGLVRFLLGLVIIAAVIPIIGFIVLTFLES